jgi:hypothetical protein
MFSICGCRPALKTVGQIEFGSSIRNSYFKFIKLWMKEFFIQKDKSAT